MKFWKDCFVPHDPVKSIMDQGKLVMMLQRDKRLNYTPIHCYNTMTEKWDDLSDFQKSVVVKVFNQYDIPWC